MTSNNPTIIGILQKLRENLISSYVDKNYSPKEILSELRKLNLAYSGFTENVLQSNIINTLYKRWDEDEKMWKDESQLHMMFWSFTKEDESRFWSSYLANLSPNQAETLLKDMKEILSNVKQITQSAERITRDIDYIVSKVKQHDKEE